MRSYSGYLAIALCFCAILALPVAAKEEIQATVHTTIPAHIEEGSQLNVSWTLVDTDSGKPINAGRVFIRLIGPAGDWTEVFATNGANPKGRYSAVVTPPKGGVSKVEIGIAGTTTYQDGRSERGDMLMPLANNPIQK